MRIAGRLAAEVLEMIDEYVRPGISTGELDRICHRYIVEEQIKKRNKKTKFENECEWDEIKRKIG